MNWLDKYLSVFSQIITYLIFAFAIVHFGFWVSNLVQLSPEYPIFYPTLLVWIAAVVYVIGWLLVHIILSMDVGHWMLHLIMIGLTLLCGLSTLTYVIWSPLNVNNPPLIWSTPNVTFYVLWISALLAFIGYLLQLVIWIIRIVKSWSMGSDNDYSEGKLSSAVRVFRRDNRNKRE